MFSEILGWAVNHPAHPLDSPLEVMAELVEEENVIADGH
jgi:hypothetical protein